MHTLLRSVPPKSLLFQAAPSGVAALVIAELFYKWHSFTLECMGFLATWYAVDLALGGARRLAERART